MSYQSIKHVLSTLDIVGKTVSHKDNKKSLQVLLKNIPDAVDEISLFRRKPDLQCYSNKIKLCSTQLAKALPSLVKLLSAGTDPALKEITHFLVDKLHWCFSEILRIIEGGGLQDDSEPSGLFIKSVDNLTSFCLNGDTTGGSMKILTEDLLCHALTIAKIAEIEDYNEIAAACRNVLTTTSGVSTVVDLEKEPLKKDTILCSVDILERKINIAVLRLYLNVSSKFLPPLKSIVKKSGNHQFYDSNKSRKAADILHEISILDQYFERVQLIGNYAVACTDCKKKKLKVQSCLASLEFIADYIITAAESFYVDPTNLVKKRFLQYLTDESLDELRALTSFLDYNIVDTAAFVQVIHEDVVEVIFRLKQKFYSGSYTPLDSNELESKIYKLVNHLKTTNDPIVKENESLTTTAKQLLNAVKDHAEQTRDPEALLNKKLFFSKLDCIISKVEELLNVLNDKYMTNISQTSCQNNLDISHLSIKKDSGRSVTTFSNCPQTSNRDNSKRPKKQIDVITSTPFAVCTKESGTRRTTYKLYGKPITPSTNVHSLDPYLSKITETPLLRSNVHVKTPYKEIYLKRTVPKHLNFNLSDTEENSTSEHSFTETVSVVNYDKKSC